MIDFFLSFFGAGNQVGTQLHAGQFHERTCDLRGQDVEKCEDLRI